MKSMGSVEYKMRFIGILIILFLAASVQAQPGKVPVAQRDGRSFYLHTVSKGQTLYAISKMYALSVASIVKDNPAAKKGLSPGDVLYIPMEEDAELKPVPDNRQGDTLYHTVSPGETMYSLCRTYHVTKEQLKEWNSVLNEHGIEAYTVLKMPVPVKAQDNTVPPIPDSLKAGVISHYLSLSKDTAARDSMPQDSLLLKERYKIALLLPFYVQKNRLRQSERSYHDPRSLYPPSIIATSFYSGVRLACDSAAHLGISVDLHVFDTDNDSATVAKIIRKDAFHDADLVMGPLYQSNFEMVEKATLSTGTHTVTPVPQGNKVLLGNPQVSKVSPSGYIQTDMMARYVAAHFADKNLVIIDLKDKTDDHDLATLRNKLKLYLNLANGLGNDSVKLIKLTSISAKKIKPNLKDSGNVLLCMSSNQTDVTVLFTALSTLTDKHEITLFGPEKWRHYDNIDIDYLHNLHIHFPSPDFVNYEDEATKHFNRMYREHYKTEPDRYALLGFDVMFYYLQALNQFGIRLSDHLPDFKYTGLCTRFDFYRPSPESGVENKGVYILEYDHYHIVNAE